MDYREAAGGVGHDAPLDGGHVAYRPGLHARGDVPVFGGHLDAATSYVGDPWFRAFDDLLDRESHETGELVRRPL